MELPSQTELHKKAKEKGSIRCGATIDVDRRKGEHETDGYSGTMNYATTQNMMMAENELLAIKKWLHNDQERSNISQEPGYVYVIKGRKY